jgi:hypothetical protein
MLHLSAVAIPRHAARLLLRCPRGGGATATAATGHATLRRMLHSGSAPRRAPRGSAGGLPAASAKPAVASVKSAGLASGSLPAWVPCSGSVTMVMRTAARGFRSGAGASRAAATEATPAAAPPPAAAATYLGYPPRVWAMGAGHCAFIMLASMYLMTDMVLLRVLGIIANAFDMLYAAHAHPSTALPAPR